VATSTIPLCEIQRSLTTGASGEDVRCLQRYLNWSGYTVATIGVGSPGNETNYFGALTAAAVARWQNANATQVLTPLAIPTGTGFWGSSSFGWYVQLVRKAFGLS
jgi:peptidoglycan hydrolase-like protein with peptidoglycan-binding domain